MQLKYNTGYKIYYTTAHLVNLY